MNRPSTQLFSVLNGYSSSIHDFHTAYTLLGHLKEIELLSLKEMAACCDCSGHKLQSFLKDLGYRNYSEFKSYCLSLRALADDQLRQRFDTYDLAKNKSAIFALSNAADLEHFFQEETLHAIVHALHESKKILVVGSNEMLSLFTSFQSDLWHMDCNVYLEFGSSLHPDYRLEENDLVIICSMTGRIQTMSPTLLDAISHYKNTLLISQFQHSPCSTFLQIPADSEIFEAYLILLFFLDTLKYMYYQRYGHDSGL